MILYTTIGCHLCEEAENLLHCVNQNYIATEIGDDDALVAEYGIRIPVVKAKSGNTLDWPFNQADLLKFISGNA